MPGCTSASTVPVKTTVCSTWTLGNAFLAEVLNWLQMPLFAALFSLSYTKSLQKKGKLRDWQGGENRGIPDIRADRYQRPSSLGHTPGFRGADWPSGGGEGLLEEEVSTFLPVSARLILL